MDSAARRYGTRPSTLLGIEHPLTAAIFDMAIAERARAWELEHRLGEFWYIGLYEFVNRLVGGED